MVNKMTKQEIMNLSGDDLDHAVAIAQGWGKGNLIWLKNRIFICTIKLYHPLTNGTQCMEIMKRERIAVEPDYDNNNKWTSVKVLKTYQNTWEEDVVRSYGETPNEAILRCFLLSKQERNENLPSGGA